MAGPREAPCPTGKDPTLEASQTQSSDGSPYPEIPVFILHSFAHTPIYPFTNVQRMPHLCPGFSHGTDPHGALPSLSQQFSVDTTRKHISNYSTIDLKCNEERVPSTAPARRQATIRTNHTQGSALVAKKGWHEVPARGPTSPFPSGG